MSGLGLVPCPLCGGRSGYRLHEIDSYRWWAVRCNGCHEQVTECRSDLRTKLGTALPQIWPAADQAWNEAGAYAEGLRIDAERYRWIRIDDQFDAAIDIAMAGYATEAKT